MSRVQHPNLISFLGITSTTEGHAGIVTRYMYAYTHLMVTAPFIKTRTCILFIINVFSLGLWLARVWVRVGARARVCVCVFACACACARVCVCVLACDCGCVRDYVYFIEYEFHNLCTYKQVNKNAHLTAFMKYSFVRVIFFSWHVSFTLGLGVVFSFWFITALGCWRKWRACERK